MIHSFCLSLRWKELYKFLAAWFNVTLSLYKQLPLLLTMMVSVFDSGMFAVEIANALIVALPPKVKRRQAATP